MSCLLCSIVTSLMISSRFVGNSLDNKLICFQSTEPSEASRLESLLFKLEADDEDEDEDLLANK